MAISDTTTDPLPQPAPPLPPKMAPAINSPLRTYPQQIPPLNQPPTVGPVTPSSADRPLGFGPPGASGLIVPPPRSADVQPLFQDRPAQPTIMPRQPDIPTDGTGGDFWTVQYNQAGRGSLTPQQLQAMPNLVRQASEQYQVPYAIMRGVTGMETDFGRNITTSSADAQGISQFIPETASKYGVDVNNIASSIHGQARYLRDLYNQYGSWPLALQAYNGALNDPSMKYARGVFAKGGAQMPEQRFIPAANMPGMATREPGQWGRAPEGGYGPLPGPGDFASIMRQAQQMQPLLSGQSAFGQAFMNKYYSDYVQGYQQGQVLSMRLAEERFKLQAEQHNEQMQEENQDIGSAIAAAGNDPIAQQDAAMRVAQKYNDRVLAEAAQTGPDAVERLMQARDRYNTDVTRMQLAMEQAQRQREADQRERQQYDEFNKAVAADDAAFLAANPNASPVDVERAHADNYQKRLAEFQGKGTKAEDPLKAAAATRRDAAVQADVNQWLQQQKQDPTRYSGGAVGQGNYTAPTQDEIAQQRDNFNTAREQAEKIRPRSQTATQAKVAEESKFVDDYIAQKEAEARRAPNFDATKLATLRPQWEGEARRLMSATRSATGPRYGTVDWAMQNWAREQENDPKRWSGGGIGQGDYTEPTTEEVEAQRGKFQQMASKEPVSLQTIGTRIEIAAGEATRGIEALSVLPSNTTLGIFGGAQAGPATDLADGVRRTLANEVTPQQSRMLAAIGNEIVRPLAALEAGGAATGVVGLTELMKKELPEKGDDGWTMLTKLANMRAVIDSAADAIADKNLEPAVKQRVNELRARVDKVIPFTQLDVALKSANPTDENMTDLAHRLMGVGEARPGVTAPKEQAQAPDKSGFVVGQPYTDAKGNKATYLGNGQWQEEPNKNAVRP